MKRPAWLTTPRCFRRLGASLLIGGQAVSAIAKGRIGFNDLMQELMEAGPGSFLIVLITALAAGTVFNIQVAAELSKQGASATVGGLLALGLSREIAPLLTATLLTGKVATAYAAQIGTMKVTEQIDAITMLRTDPVEYLVVPRVLAMVIMAPVQCLLFFWVGIWSGQVSSTLLYNIPPAVFWNSVRTWMEPNDLPSMLLKALVFGLQIAVLACGWGLTTRGGPKEVGTSTTGAVVMILITVALMDARNHTLHLIGQLVPALELAGLAVLHGGEHDPPLWTLGHIGWFQERWVARNVHRNQGRGADPTASRLPSVEPQADRWWDDAQVPQDQRATLSLPSLEQIRSYLMETLETTLELLEKAPDTDPALYFFRLALCHEDMRGESLIELAQSLGCPLDIALPGAMALRPPLLVPAARWMLGSPPEPGFSFDNERAAHAVDVPEFEIDAQPVSWAQYVEFVDDGGYDRPELWLPAGWEWLQSQSAGQGGRAPRYVEQIGVASGAVMQTRFGSPRRMLGGQPVMSPTGHAIMKLTMNEVNAVLGGELSGHIFYRHEHWGFDDGLHATLRILMLLLSAKASHAKMSLSGLLAQFPSSALSEERRVKLVKSHHEMVLKSVLSLAQSLTDSAGLPVRSVETLDGIRVNLAGGFWLVFDRLMGVGLPAGPWGF
jgi:phospholipid/cholesterol/gamma-HCH transport system permease protein